MPFHVENLAEAIRAAKAQLRRELPSHSAVFAEVESELRRKVVELVREREQGGDVIPSIPYSDIAAGSVAPETIAKLKERGACVVRQTFPSEHARAWDHEVARYVEENALYDKLARFR